MSVEIWFYPKAATKEQLRRHLLDHGFSKTLSLFQGPPGTLHYFWFDETDFRSAVGVEANIYLASKVTEGDHWPGFESPKWILHTRTRASASTFDRRMQNEIARSARRKFGGSFYNDWHGKNRYTPLWEESHTPAERGIIAVYNSLQWKFNAVLFNLPESKMKYEAAEKNKAMDMFIRQVDPTTYLYNALIPYAIAALENFFRSVFIILLRYDSAGQSRIANETRRVDMADALALASGKETIEGIVANWYSFQNINGIHKAYSDWLGIDFWRILRTKKSIGRKASILSDVLDTIIESRHDLIHRFELKYGLDRDGIVQIFQTIEEIMNVFVEHLVQEKGMDLVDDLSSPYFARMQSDGS